MEYLCRFAITNIWQQYQRNTLDSKVYFESNTEEEELKETTIEDIDPSVAKAYQKKEMDEWSEEKIFDHQLQLWEDTSLTRV